MRLVHWNGKDLPAELNDLPPGDYVIEPADEAVELTADEQRGLVDALRALRDGEGIPLEEVRRRLNERYGH